MAQHKDSSEDLNQGFRYDKSTKKLLTIFLSINVCLFPAVAIFFAANPSLPQFYCPIIASAEKIEKTDRTRNFTDLNFFSSSPSYTNFL